MCVTCVPVTHLPASSPRPPQFLNLVETVGLDEVAEALPGATQQFAPLMVADHFAAM